MFVLTERPLSDPSPAAPSPQDALGGGRAGERLLGRLGMARDADTIVRVVKRGAPPADIDATLRVVGIDDWAWQKGQQHLGTIFVDLERRRVVDVLGARTAQWLAAHAGMPPFGSSAVIAAGHMPTASAGARR